MAILEAASGLRWWVPSGLAIILFAHDSKEKVSAAPLSATGPARALAPRRMRVVKASLNIATGTSIRAIMSLCWPVCCQLDRMGEK